MRKNSGLDQSIVGFPGQDQIKEAHQRIRPFINRTPVLTSTALNNLFGGEVFFKCENFQKVGAFKARGATNAVMQLDHDAIVHGVATHSSGNHAQALSWAASLRKTSAYIVMPSDSSRVKINAVREYGGIITFCEPNLAARESTLHRVLEETGATEIHPYNNHRIICGQGTAALELIEEIPDLDIVLAPVGGGGLLSGTALSVHYFSPRSKVIAAEPEQADDAFQSFQKRVFVPSIHPNTMADGLRTSLGTLTYPVIMEHVHDIVTVSEKTIIQAMRLIWERMKIIIEPSSAVPVAAIMEGKVNMKNRRCGLIISGGNVDLDQLPWIK